MRALLLVPLLCSTAPAFGAGSGIKGRVRYEGPRPAPEPVKPHVNPEVCGAGGPLPDERLVVDAEGGLAHVALLLVDQSERSPERREARLEQRGCRFLPHLQTVTAGSTLLITNDDPVVHNVHARRGEETVFNLGMPLKGARLSRRLEQPGVLELSCDSGHSWMRAYLVVVPHSYHTTSGDDGRFFLGDVAPGRYTLRAWHETLGVRQASVVVEAGKDSELELSYGPAAEHAMPALSFTSLPDPLASEPQRPAPATSGSTLAATRAERAADLAGGRPLFRRHCAPCHGDAGDGRGEAARHLSQRPRDFTRGEYKLRSTPTGQLPRLEDLSRTIELGMPGTDMPAWGRRLGAAERTLLARYLMALSPRFLAAPPGAPVPIPAEPTPDAAAVARGRAQYERLKCAQCHGPQGRADGVSTAMRDDWGEPIAPGDLTRGVYKSGPRARDLYRTLVTGLSGTPMPDFAEAATPAELWDLVHYLLSLAT